MKAMHKQLWGYLLITLSLAGFTPLQAQTDSVDEGGYITVSGIVKDKKSKKSLEYVNISIPGSTTGTVTNADGEFSFKVKDSIHAKEVEISHLGYFNSKIELNGKDVEEQTVWLTPTRICSTKLSSMPAILVTWWKKQSKRFRPTTVRSIAS